MKCLSLWQPWASAIALGFKSIETRSWSTSHREWLAIHAAKRKFSDAEWMEIDREFGHLLDPAWNLLFEMRCTLPLGSIVAVARLTDCIPTEKLVDNRKTAMYEGWIDPLTDRELQFGNYEPGRFGWMLSNVQALPEPIPWKGAQGLFEVPDEVLRRAA